MHLVPVLAAEQKVGLDAIFNHVGGAHSAGEQSVETEVPPEVVMEKLRAALHFPLAQEIEVSQSSIKIPPGPSPLGAPRALT